MAAVLFCPGVWAEVVILHDGTVHIGQIRYAENGIARYQTANRLVELRSLDILDTSPDFGGLRDRPLVVVMADGTRLVGRVSDYDPDLGLCLEMDMGSILLPVNKISRLFDPELAGRYAGEGQSVRVGFACSGAVDRLQGYGAWSGPRLATLFSIPAVRGLHLGPVACLSLPAKLPQEDNDIFLAGLTLAAGYRFHFLDLEPAPLSWLVPFFRVAAGAVVTSCQAKDAAKVPASLASLSGCVGIELGTEINPLPWLTGSLSFLADVVLYQPKPELFLGGCLSLGIKW